MNITRLIRGCGRWITGLVLTMTILSESSSTQAQVQHPLAARRVHRYRVHERRENVAEVREERAENVAGRRAAVASRAVLPRYAPATIAPGGTLVVPPVTVVRTPVVSAAPATAATEEADAGLPSDVPADMFEGSTSYQVVRLEDGGVTVVLRDGSSDMKVRMLGVSAVTLSDQVQLPERLSGLRLPSTENFVNNLLRGERVYVVYDTQVAEADADGKTVAYLFRAPDGLLINLEVIRAGFAVADAGYDYDQQAAFTSYQAAAQKVGKGIYGILQRLRNARGEE